jgi:excisionase family DNA binding protein
MYARNNNRAIGRARVSQIDRVNSTDDSRVQELRSQIADLQRLLDSEREQNRRLQAQLDGITGPSRGGNSRSATMLHNGRPVITPMQAAAQLGVSLSTVIRYLNEGRWEAAQIAGSNRWLVYADQTLARKDRKKRKTRRG